MLASALYAGSLIGLGNLTAHYRKGHSLKTNVLGWLAEKMQLFPMVPPAEKDCEEAVRWHRERWALAARVTSGLPTMPSIHATLDAFVPSRDKGRAIHVRFYRPCRPNEAEKLPLVVYLHGGGWVFGSVDAYEGVCRNLANICGVVICSVEYRLAPEHKFPCGLNDVIDVVRWAQTTTLMDCDPVTRGLGICGDSAGGNLAASAALLLKDEVNLKAQLLIYPATCAYGMPLWRNPPMPHYKDSMVQHTRGIGLTSAVFPWFWTLYLEDAQQAFDPRASPMLCKDVRGVCQAVIITANGDPLFDEGWEYGEMLKRNGVKVEMRNFPDAHHGFLMVEQAEHFDEAFQSIGASMARIFGTSGGNFSHGKL